MILRNPGTHGAFRIGEGNRLDLSGFTAIADEGPLAYVRPRGVLGLLNVRVRDVTDDALLIGPGSVVDLERTSITSRASERASLLTIARGDDDPRSASIAVGPGCFFRGLKYSMRQQNLYLTRDKSKAWGVAPEADERRGLFDLHDALLLAADGEEVQIAPGTYRLPSIVLASNVRIIGAGSDAGGTLLISDFAEKTSTVTVPPAGKVWIEGVTVEAGAPFMYVDRGASVTLRRVVLRGGNGHWVTSVFVGEGASLALDDSDLTHWQTPTVVSAADGDRPGTILLAGLSVAMRDRIRGGRVEVTR